MTDKAEKRFDKLLKAMLKGEPPKRKKSLPDTTSGNNPQNKE